jgi:hypothetical protein
MVRLKTGDLVMANEDIWFTEALYKHITTEAVRLVVMAENIYFKNKISPRQEAIAFVLKVIKAMLENKLKETRTDMVKIEKTYYVEITSGKEFERQPLVPFKDFYKWFTTKGIHRGSNPSVIGPEELYAIASESKTVKGNL